MPKKQTVSIDIPPEICKSWNDKIEKAADEIQRLQKDCIDYAELLDAIETIKAEHPHDIFSLDDDLTHGFNQGWEAACDRIKSMLEAKMRSNETEGSL